MAHLVQSKTPMSEKNRLSTTLEAFSDAKLVSGLAFVLDAAAEPETTKCLSFISPEQDALSACWGVEFHKALKRYTYLEVAGICGGRPMGIWCNPPFDLKHDFIQKAYDTARTHGIPVLMMLPYEPTTVWWRVMVDGFASVVYEPRGRYNYYEVDGKTLKRGINFPSCFVLYNGSCVTNTQYIKYIPALLPFKAPAVNFAQRLAEAQKQAHNGKSKRELLRGQLNRLPTNDIQETN